MRWIVLIALGAAPCRGEVEVLPETVVTASRSEEPLADSAAGVSLLDGDEIFAKGLRTLPEAMEEWPGVMVQKTARGHGSPYIRGFTSFRNLLLIDGIRFNNSVFRDGPNQYWNTIDPFSLERVELVRGPGSMLYGSDAIGGTVNALTKGTGLLDAGEGMWFQPGSVSGRVDSASGSIVGRVEQAIGRGGEWGLMLGGSWKDFGDLRGADVGTMERSGYDEWAVDGKFEWAVSPTTLLTLAHQRLRQDDVWRSHRTVFGVSWEGTTVGDELRRVFGQERSLSYARLQGEEAGGWLNRWEATVSFQTMEEERDRVRANLRRDLQGVDVDTYGATLQLESVWSGGKLVYGADYYRDEVDSFRTDFNADGSLRAIRIQGPVGDDATYETFGAFVQNQWEPADGWELTTGARLAAVDASIGRVEDPVSGLPVSIEDSWETVVFSGRALRRINPCWNVFAGLSQGFRAPNLSDLSRLDSARSNEIETPSPGLHPEEFLSGDLGARYVGDGSTFFVSAFYTDIRDMIVRAPTGIVIDGDNEVTKRNAGDGYVYGVEAGGEWEFLPQWTAFGHLAWIDGKVDSFPSSAPVAVDEPLDRLMPFTGRAGVRYDRDGWWVEGLVNFAAEADRLSTRDRSDTQRIPPGGTPGYVVPTLRGGWQVTPQLLLTLALENLSDSDFRIHGSGVNESGFNAILGARLEW